MADPAWRQQQWDDRYAAHVREINEWVDTIQRPDDGLRAPYVAPYYGGEHARILSVLRDPGTGADAANGSGFLCMENDDPTSLRQREAFQLVGIEPRDLVPWNAYPYFINRKPTTTELERGADLIASMLALPSLNRVRAVLLQGGDAQEMWRRLLRRYPTIEVASGVRTFSTYHPAPGALRTSLAGERERREHQRIETYRALAAYVRAQ